MTAILLVGFALLTLWPAYNLALVAFTTSDSATAGRRRRRDAVAPNEHEPLTFWIVVPASTRSGLSAGPSPPRWRWRARRHTHQGPGGR